MSRRWMIAVATLLLCLATVRAASEQRAAIPSTELENQNLWFVELNLPPAAEGTKLQALRAEKAAFRTAAARAGLHFTERYAYDTLWNGLSVRVAPDELGKLWRLPGVKSLYPVTRFSLPEPRPDASEIASSTQAALAMTGADRVQSELGLTGAGVRVGIVDTGIDYDHPDLGGCFGPGCRVETGWDFYGDGPVPVPDSDPDDCDGHGTFVAGVVGANGAIKGVAPGVTFGAYKVANCTEFAYDDVIMAAMERALDDGMDVINLSFGPPPGYTDWPEDPFNQAADRLVNSGVVVVGAAGNDGKLGALSTSGPSIASKVIGVGSVDSDLLVLPHFEVAGRRIAYQPMIPSISPPLSGTGEIVYVGTACDEGSLVADPNGKVALVASVASGPCWVGDAVDTAVTHGATAVAVYENPASSEFFSFPFIGFHQPPIPVVAISLEDGLLLRLLGTPAPLEWGGPVPFPRAGLLSSFSSFGLAADLTLKPNLVAPGGYILSTFPLEWGGYTVASGTSSSSPYVAGAVALLLQSRPQTPSQAVRGILESSADPTPWWLDPQTSSLEPVIHQGAGLLDIGQAIESEVSVQPAELALGEGDAGPQQRTLEVENHGGAPVTFDVSHEPALSAASGEFFPDLPEGSGLANLTYSASHAVVGFDAASVTVPPGGTARIGVSITPPSTPDLGQYGGYLTLTPQESGEPLRVPYAGFIGNYQQLPAFDPTPFLGLPWLSKSRGGHFYNMPAGATFSMVGEDIPWIALALAHPVRRLRVEVVDADSGRSWHRVFDFDYYPQRPPFALSWDGWTVNGNHVQQVPDGRYVLVVSVLKALGDPDNPDDSETWISPVITIDRSPLPASPSIDATVVAALWQPAPGGGMLVNDIELGEVNASGEAVLAADLSTGGETVLRANGSGLHEVVRPGDPSPGGGTFGPYVLGTTAIDSAGDLAFSFLLGPYANPFGTNGGVFRQSAGGVLEELVTPGVTLTMEGAPLVGASDPDVDDSGGVVFTGIVFPPIPFFPFPPTGIYRVNDPGSVETIAGPKLSLTSADPLTERFFFYAQDPATSSGGDVAFWGRGKEPCGAVPEGCEFQSIFLRPAGSATLQKVASVGDPAPGHGTSTFGSLAAPVLDSAPDVLFWGDDSLGQGLYLASSAGLRPVVQTEDSLPGGGRFWGVPEHIRGLWAIDDAGEIAFVADLEPWGRGVYLERSDTLELVARTGTVVNGLGTILTIGEFPGVALDGDGNVMFVATLDDGRTVLLRAQP